HYLLEALVEVKAEGGRPATLVMAGGGPDFEKVKAEIATLGLERRVSLVGVKPARAVLPQGRIAVVPLLAQSLPYVVLEAARAALTVIAARVTVIAVIVGPTAATVVSPGDVGALRQEMQGALHAPDAAKAEAAARLAHNRAEFSVERMAESIEALYR